MDEGSLATAGLKPSMAAGGWERQKLIAGSPGHSRGQREAGQGKAPGGQAGVEVPVLRQNLRVCNTRPRMYKLNRPRAQG